MRPWRLEALGPWRRAMKPIGPSVPLTRPPLVPPSAEQSPPIVRSPPPAASSATGTLARHARLRGAKIYCKLRWLYFGHNQRFSTLSPQEPSQTIPPLAHHAPLPSFKRLAGRLAAQTSERPSPLSLTPKRSGSQVPRRFGLRFYPPRSCVLQSLLYPLCVLVNVSF